MVSRVASDAVNPSPSVRAPGRWRPLARLACGALLLAGCRRDVADASSAAADGGVVLDSKQISQMKIASEVVKDESVDDTILTSGKVTFDDQRVMHVFSPVSGKVTKIAVELGQHVDKGALLALVESPDIGVASSDVGKAKADLVAAQHDFDRQKDLFAEHASSQRDVEQAEDNFHRAQAELARSEQKAHLFRAGDVDLVSQSYALRSDMAGEVFMRAVSPGMEIQGQYSGGSAVELFTIGETDKVWLIADVFEIDLPRVKLGSKVLVSVVSYPGRTFEGRVDWVSGMLDPQTHAAHVRCTFDNADGALRPEMYATVQISVDVKSALAIPRPAVLRLGDQTVVFIDKGADPNGRHHYERMPVTVDEGEGSKWLTVDHGLDRGQRVVTQGAIMLASML